MCFFIFVQTVEKTREPQLWRWVDFWFACGWWLYLYDFFLRKPLGGSFAHCFAVHFFLLIAATFFTKGKTYEVLLSIEKMSVRWGSNFLSLRRNEIIGAC